MATLIRGGTVVNHDWSRRADVLVDGSTIVAVGSKLEAPAGAEVIDAGGCYVLPGGIDPHTHMELLFMGTVSADDFEWGTKAALSGGTTMIVDFCIPAPGQSMLAAYQDWRRKAEKAAADYGFHMAVTWWSEQVWEEMETVVKTYGINTFKHFMAYKGALMVDDDQLYHSFSRCAGLGAMPLVPTPIICVTMTGKASGTAASFGGSGMSSASGSNIGPATASLNSTVSLYLPASPRPTA